MDTSNEPPGAYGEAVDYNRWVVAATLVKQLVHDELGAIAARVKRLAVRVGLAAARRGLPAPASRRQYEKRSASTGHGRDAHSDPGARRPAPQARRGTTATAGTPGHDLVDLSGAIGNVVRAAGDTGSAHPAPDRSLPQRLPFGGATAATDQDLDADLAAWLEPASNRPRIGVLGEVSVEAPGQPPADRQSFYAEIAVLLAVMGTRGVTAAELEEAIWPRPADHRRQPPGDSEPRASLAGLNGHWPAVAALGTARPPVPAGRGLAAGLETCSDDCAPAANSPRRPASRICVGR